MPYDWENQDFSNLMEPQEESPDAFQQQYKEMTSIADVDEAMSEAERRFEIAQHYKLLLRDNLFANQSDISEIVEAEIRTFIRERLGVLLGVKPAPAASSGFTPEQVAVLSSFADLGEEAPEMLKALMGRITKKMVKTPPKVKEEPTLKVVKEPTRPTLKKAEEPKLRTSTAEAPKEAPVARGKRMKLPIPEKYKNDPTLKIEGNKIFVQARNTDGELMYKTANGQIVTVVDNTTQPVYKDITPKATPVGVKPVPMPSSAQLEIVTAQAAEKVVREVGKGDSLIINQLKDE